MIFVFLAMETKLFTRTEKEAIHNETSTSLKWNIMPVPLIYSIDSSNKIFVKFPFAFNSFLTKLPII